MWIFQAHPWNSTQDFQNRYVNSDMRAYWDSAAKVWQDAPQWSNSDQFYPPLTAQFFASTLGSTMDHLGRTQWVQWTISMGILLEIALIAWLAFGRRAAGIALGIGAISFPLFFYTPYILAENPFAFLITTGVLFFFAALRDREFRVLCLLVAGMCFALSAGFKSVGFLSALFLLPSFLSVEWDASRMKRFLLASCFLFGLLGMLMVPLGMSIERNKGSFIFLSNDIMRIALVNHGDVLGVTTVFPNGEHYIVISPVMNQRGFTEMREITPDKGHILRDNIRWMMAHPVKGFIDMLYRFTDFFGGSMPFPSTHLVTQFKTFVLLFQFLFLLLIYVPAGLFLMKRCTWRPARIPLNCQILLLPILGLLSTAIIAASEPRYLYPFAGLLVVLASAFYAETKANRHD